VACVCKWPEYKARSQASVERVGLGFKIPQDGILHSHLYQNHKILHSINRLGCVVEKYCVSCEVLPDFYILEEDILHSHRRNNLKPYRELNGWAL
jgi:hypothetical protein